MHKDDPDDQGHPAKSGRPVATGNKKALLEEAFSLAQRRPPSMKGKGKRQGKKHTMPPVGGAARMDAPGAARVAPWDKPADPASSPASFFFRFLPRPRCCLADSGIFLPVRSQRATPGPFSFLCGFHFQEEKKGQESGTAIAAVFRVAVADSHTDDNNNNDYHNAMMSSPPIEPYARLTEIVEVSLPAALSHAAQPRLIAGPPGTPDVPYVDSQWPADEARILQRYRFLGQLANAIHPSATINPAAVSAALGLVDPVAGTSIIRGAAADAARGAVDRYDMRAARAALVEGALAYARDVEADARAAVARLDERFNRASLARSVSPALRARAVTPPAAAAAPVRPLAPITALEPQAAPPRLPAGLQRAMTSLLGRRPPAERPAAAAPPLPPPTRPAPAWSAALRRLIPAALPRRALPLPAARPYPQVQEEEEEEPIVKRQRRTPTLAPILSMGAVATDQEDDDLLLALLAEEEEEQQRERGEEEGDVVPAARGWNLSAALAAAARRPPSETVEYLSGEVPRAARQEQEEQEEQEPWTIDAHIQIVAPSVFRREVDLDTVRAEAERARATADAIRDAYAARASEDGSDLEAAVSRAEYLQGLAAYIEASQAGMRRAPEPFDAAYWYRVVSAAGSGPLGPPSSLAAAGGVHGPYATVEDATADATVDGFNVDGALMDAALAWASATNATSAETAVFQVQRPLSDRDPPPPRQLAARVDPGVERWMVAVVAPRSADAPPEAGAFTVLAWDRAVGGRAQRVGVRDVFCPTGGPPCAVVAAYETVGPEEARAVEEALLSGGAPRDMAEAVGEISAAARALYPGAAVDVAPNRDRSALAVTVRLPVPLAQGDPDRLLAVVRAVYGVVAATGANVDTDASRVVGADGDEAPIPLPLFLVAGPSS